MLEPRCEILNTSGHTPQIPGSLCAKGKYFRNHNIYNRCKNIILR